MSNRRYMRHYRIEGQALPIRLELPGALATAPVTELSERLGQRLIPITKDEYKRLLALHNAGLQQEEREHVHL